MTDDREPQPGDGPEYDANHRWWEARQGYAWAVERPKTVDYRTNFKRAMDKIDPNWDNPTIFWSPERDASFIQAIEILTMEVADLRAEREIAVRLAGDARVRLAAFKDKYHRNVELPHCDCMWCRGETMADGACGCEFCRHRRMNEEMENR